MTSQTKQRFVLYFHKANEVWPQKLKQITIFPPLNSIEITYITNKKDSHQFRNLSLDKKKWRQRSSFLLKHNWKVD